MAPRLRIEVAVRVDANDSSLPVKRDTLRTSDGKFLTSKQAYANNRFESGAFWI